MEPGKIYNVSSKRLLTIGGVQYNKLIKSGYYVSNNQLLPPIKEPVFTNNPDIDIQILSNLDDKVLSVICNVNKYINNLCNDNMLWKIKINNFIPNLPVTENYKEIYFAIKKIYNDFESDRKGYTDILGSQTKAGELSVVSQWAVKKGYFDIVKWIASTYNKYPFEGLCTAIHFNKLEILKWLIKESERVIINIKDYNNLPTSLSFKNKDVDDWWWDCALEISYDINLPMLKFLHAQKVLSKDNYQPEILAKIAAGVGNFKLLKWLIKTFNIQLDKHTIKKLKKIKKYPDIVQWLEDNNK
jgi:hypothetical protein